MTDSGMFDKVVEFGMGMAMMQQIPQMMNTANASATQPVPPPLPKANAYFLAIGGKQYGPYTADQLRPFVPTGQIAKETLVWCQGMPAWQQAATVAELAPLFPV
ncbi:MAG: DUF4339 domain-containing protein [Paludibacteraceae bacterium]|nr:DUF4339 domain-containing protein [Paludibacteraceae bacterium]